MQFGEPVTEEVSLRGKNKSTEDKASNECSREVRGSLPKGTVGGLSESFKSTALKRSRLQRGKC